MVLMQSRFCKHNVIAALMLAFAMMASRGTCQFLIQSDIAKSDLVEKVPNAEIDWGNECYFATGEAVVPTVDEESNRSRAQLKARGSAKTKAITNLMAAVGNTLITCKAIGKDYISKDPRLQQMIEDYSANAEIVEEKLRPEGDDTVVMVTVKAPMYGAGSVGLAILGSKFVFGSTEIPSDGLMVEKRRDAKATSVSANAKGPFTSLIIDCSGLDLQRAMNPKIRRTDNTKIWGVPSTGLYFLQERGMASYAKSIEEAKHISKAGTNPLIVRAAGRAGARFMCDVVISDSDADMIIKENLSSKFMDKPAVILVVDAK